jgi:small neutral amino acid transporter SnatA (MarC family)
LCHGGGVLLVFASAGSLVFQIFSITMPAFQIAASIVLLAVALDMLRAQRSRVHETEAETQAGVEKTDIAITPLAIPMLSGPGAISTTILLQNQARGFAQHIALYACIAIVALRLLLDFPGRRPGRPLAEPHGHEHRHPDHGLVARGDCRPIHAQCHQSFSD